MRHSNNGRPPLLYPAERAASDYFNSLPREQREKLSPLLEHYRLLGMAEAHRDMHASLTKLGKRMHGIVDRENATFEAREPGVA